MHRTLFITLAMCALRNAPCGKRAPAWESRENCRCLTIGRARVSAVRVDLGASPYVPCILFTTRVSAVREPRLRSRLGFAVDFRCFPAALFYVSLSAPFTFPKGFAKCVSQSHARKRPRSRKPCNVEAVQPKTTKQKNAQCAKPCNRNRAAETTQPRSSCEARFADSRKIGALPLTFFLLKKIREMCFAKSRKRGTRATNSHLTCDFP